MIAVPSSIGATLCIFALTSTISFAQASPADSPATPTLSELGAFLQVRSWRSVVPLPSKSFTATLYHFADGKLGKRLIPSPAAPSEQPESNLTIIAGHDNGNYKLYLSLGAGLALSQTTSVPVFDAEVPQTLPERLAAGDYVLFGVARNDFKDGDKPSIETYSKGILLRVETTE